MHYLDNLLLNTDSYKASHWLQYPPGTDATFFYVESRGGQYDRTLFFGLQALLKDYLAKPITHADIDVARDLFAAHGEPFNEAGWRYIVDTHGGLLPLQGGRGALPVHPAGRPAADPHPRRARRHRGAGTQRVDDDRIDRPAGILGAVVS